MYRRRILITGAVGCLGKELAGFLQVVGAGDLLLTDISALPGAAKSSFRRCDLSNDQSARRLLSWARPDCIFHVAGIFSADAGQLMRANFIAAKNILEYVRENRPGCRVVLLGSAAEYGRPSRNPVRESEPLRPLSPYGFSKMLQTLLGQYYWRAYGLQVIIARPFNLYGPGISSKLFPGRLSEAIEDYSAGRISRMEFGSLSSIRDFIHVSEAVKLLATLCEKGNHGEVYNLASGRPERIRDFMKARLAERGIPFRAVRANVPRLLNSNEVRCIYADVSKLKRVLGAG